MESALNRVRTHKATKLQSFIRMKRAMKEVRTRLNARKKIQRRIVAFINHKRWKELLMLHAKKFLTIVVRIQQRFRFKRRREMIMNYFRVRKQAGIKIQKALRRQWAFDRLVKNLNRRSEARRRL